MNSEEQNLIEGLFTRLHDAERQSAPRDAQAEAQINQFLVRQPAAPYYMAQAILIQEAAIKRLDQRVKELEAQVAEQQQNRPSSGGFLAGLFGGGGRETPPPAQPQQRPDGWGQTRFSQPGAAPAGNNYGNPNDFRQAAPPPQAAVAQGGGFMRGALQTAAGVAGGIVVADLLTNMFHHSQPQEIVEVIREEVPAQGSGFDNNAYDDRNDDFGGADRYADNSGVDNSFDDGGFDDGGSFFDDGDMFS
ncbi:MAG: hypothetical protein GAK45_00039 [Pseudomonas citronellolis]|nr:MAG: hypothetical protein GAK45_00039 [Pseudomonas citronellolis]